MDSVTVVAGDKGVVIAVITARGIPTRTGGAKAVQSYGDVVRSGNDVVERVAVRDCRVANERIQELKSPHPHRTYFSWDDLPRDAILREIQYLHLVDTVFGRSGYRQNQDPLEKTGCHALGSSRLRRSNAGARPLPGGDHVS